MFSNKDNQIRAVILIPFSIILVLIIVLFISSSYLREQDAQSTIITKVVNQVVREYTNQINSDSEMMLIAINSLLMNKDLQNTFQNRDRQALYELVQPLFQQYEDEHLPCEL